MRQKRDKEDDALGVQRRDRIGVGKKAPARPRRRRGLVRRRNRHAGAKELDAEIQQIQSADPFDDGEPERRRREERTQAQQRHDERGRVTQRDARDQRDVGTIAVRRRVADDSENRRAGNHEHDRRSCDKGEP